MMKAKTKMIIDILMTLGLLFTMGYQFWGDQAHEWVGAGMFLLFIAHHTLNRRWYAALFRGKYTTLRVAQTIVDLLVLAAMLMLMYSGIVLSRYVFAFLPINTGLAMARRLHILGSYWGFVLMSLHLGLHWKMILSRLPKINKTYHRIAFCLGGGIAVYGAWAFVKRDFPTYMLLKSEFVFLDYGESVVLFYLDYIAMMGAFIFLAYLGARIAKKRKKGVIK